MAFWLKIKQFPAIFQSSGIPAPDTLDRPGGGVENGGEHIIYVTKNGHIGRVSPQISEILKFLKF